MQGLILYDDGYEGLAPLTDLRGSFELRTGALTTSERVADRVGRHADALIVPAGLAELIAERHTEPVNRMPGGGFDSYQIVNGRWTGLGDVLPTDLNTAVVDDEGGLVAAWLDREKAEAFMRSPGVMGEGVERVVMADSPMISRPWHVLDRSDANLLYDMVMLGRRMETLNDEPAPRVTIVGDHPVLIGRDTVVHPHVVFDTTAGPIAVDNGAEVRSMSVVVGPGYIGAGSVVTNHAHIRGHCIIGPVCKVGGEVNASVFQGYANKAHGGYLGDSYVGEWVNLGAATNTSNLKNTYGEVRMQTRAGAAAEATGRTNMGSILGDHVKTAIGTRLMTGACINTGAMLAVAGFPPKFVDRFAFMTDGGQGGEPEAVTRFDFDKFCGIAETVMERRNLKLTGALRSRLTELYAM